MPQFYFAAVREWMAHEICAFRSEEDRDAWVAKQDVNALADPQWYADDDRIALTEEEAEEIVGADELRALQSDPSCFQDETDLRIWILTAYT